MAESYIQMFQETYYPPVFLEMAAKTIKQFVESEEEIVKDWKGVLGRYMERLARQQEEEYTEPVAEIDISFLYTSLEEGHPRFRIDSYGEGGRVLQESMETTYLTAEWITCNLEEMTEQLKERARMESLRRYIRPAELEVLKLRAARSLLFYFTDRFKYAIQEILDLKSLARIKKAEVFVIQMGEYMDWQKTIYAILPEIDIFNCDKGTELRFRRFPAIYYQKKQFKNLNLCQSRFEDCTFCDTVIEGCCMNDCIFDGCSFENVTITGGQMAGSLFRNCTFHQVKFEHVLLWGISIEGHEAEYFELTEFSGCSFIHSVFQESLLPNCIVRNCEAQDLELLGGDIENAGFLEMEGVVWNRGSQEG